MRTRTKILELASEGFAKRDNTTYQALLLTVLLDMRELLIESRPPSAEEKLDEMLDE